jgi:hypothetical protein
MMTSTEAPDHFILPSQTTIEGHSGNMNTIYKRIIETLEENVRGVQYGEVSVQCKIHSGRICSVCHSITNNRIEKGEQADQFLTGGEK